MERRELFKILTSGLAAQPYLSAQHRHPEDSPPSLRSYQPRFFSRAEYEVIDRLCEIIIPSDHESPGAHQSGVPYYIDTILLYSDKRSLQPLWSSGLEAVQEASVAQFGKGFLECSAPQQEQIVALMASHEGMPSNELENFFGRLKAMAIEGYHLSDIGMSQHLGYKGNQVLSEFPGCTHPEHQK